MTAAASQIAGVAYDTSDLSRHERLAAEDPQHVAQEIGQHQRDPYRRESNLDVVHQANLAASAFTWPDALGSRDHRRRLG